MLLQIIMLYSTPVLAYVEGSGLLQVLHNQCLYATAWQFRVSDSEAAVGH